MHVCEPMPDVEETYHPGAVFELYSWQVPSPPTNTDQDTDTHDIYESRPVPTQLSERYNKSIAERVALPSTPPAVSIVLEMRLDSSICRVPHVWTARVQGSSSPAGATTTIHTTYPPQLVAKIFDPVFFNDDETMWDDPFILRDLAISSEVEAYRRLGPLQGTKVPRFYGYFAAAVPGQQGRTVYIILLEKVPGRDLGTIVPPDVAENVCIKHRDAIIDAAFRLFFNILAYGVKQEDMKSRNVILRPQKHGSSSVSRTRFCDTKECMLVLEVDCDDLDLVMVDFEMVEFEEPNGSYNEEAVQTKHIKDVEPSNLAGVAREYVLKCFFITRFVLRMGKLCGGKVRFAIPSA